MSNQVLIFSILILNTFALKVLGQVKIIPTIAFELSTVDHDSNSEIVVNDSSLFNSPGVQAGISMEYQFTHKLSVFVNSAWSKHKNLSYLKEGILENPIRKSSYDVFRNSIGLTFYPTQIYFLSIGPSFNCLTNIKLHYSKETEKSGPAFEYGYHFISGFVFDRFSVKVGYYGGINIKHPDVNGTYQGLIFKPSKTIYLGAGYIFQVDTPINHAPICPEF